PQQQDARASILAQPWRIASQTSCVGAAKSGTAVIVRTLAMSTTANVRTRVKVTMLLKEAEAVPPSHASICSTFQYSRRRASEELGNFAARRQISRTRPVQPTIT